MKKDHHKAGVNLHHKAFDHGVIFDVDIPGATNKRDDLWEIKMGVHLNPEGNFKNLDMNNVHEIDLRTQHTKHVGMPHCEANSGERSWVHAKGHDLGYDPEYQNPAHDVHGGY